MKLETKYDIGQEVYYMEDNKIKSMIIQSIKVSRQTYYDNSFLQQMNCYSSDIYGKSDFIFEIYLFRTKEELLKTL